LVGWSAFNIPTIALTPAPAVVMTINVPELVEITRSRVTRGFTESECATFHVDPCPNLKDIKTGSA
jgi:hypothetical protein